MQWTKDKKDKRGSLKISPELHAQLSHFAVDAGVSAQEVVRLAWEYYRARFTWLVGTAPREIISDNVSDMTYNPDTAVRQIQEIIAGTKQFFMRLEELLGQIESRHATAPQNHHKAASPTGGKSLTDALDTAEHIAGEIEETSASIQKIPRKSRRSK